jgi:hypothetical protein
MRVRPEYLDGIENVEKIWQWDRYHGEGWRFWLPNFAGGTVKYLVPYETYRVKAKAEGLLGYGRFQLAVVPGLNRWAYL